MRHLLFAGAAALLLSSLPAVSVQAQTTTPVSTTGAASKLALKDGVFRRNGLMMRLQAGEATRLSAPISFENGLVARPDGILISKDGTRQLLGEGKAVNRQGQIVNLVDDMLTASAIEQRARQQTGQPTETRLVVPDAGSVPARLGAELLRIEQRLTLLQQLSTKLAERTAAAAGNLPAAAPLDAKLGELDKQLTQ
jgi:hypothetical protein